MSTSIAQKNSIHHSELKSEAHTHEETQEFHQVTLMKDVSRHERLITEALTHGVGSARTIARVRSNTSRQAPHVKEGQHHGGFPRDSQSSVQNTGRIRRNRHWRTAHLEQVNTAHRKASQKSHRVHRTCT